MRLIYVVLACMVVLLTEAVVGAGRGTYAVGEVRNQVADLDIALLKFAVQPAGVRLAA
jgi:hypothetical protein